MPRFICQDSHAKIQPTGPGIWYIYVYIYTWYPGIPGIGIPYTPGISIPVYLVYGIPGPHHTHHRYYSYL